jgi:hypothetical protein
VIWIRVPWVRGLLLWIRLPVKRITAHLRLKNLMDQIQ